jgi:hypothetical protein
VTGTILLVIGVVALFAAIVGGGIKIRDIEVGTVPSLWRQALLGAFGIVVTALGLALMDDDNSATNATENTINIEQNSDTNSSDANATDSNTVDENASDANATDENATDTSSENNASL